MAAGLLYRIQGTNVEGKFFKVDILDNSIQTDGLPQVIELDGGDSPITLSSIDNDEGKFTALRSQQCTIRFLSNSQYGVRTFSTGKDARFTVIVLYETTIVFQGFLSLDDNKELFVAGRNVVELTANDKLASLRDVKMVDLAGNVPRGKYTIAEWVAMCLRLTGTPLPLRMVNTLVHGTGSRTITNVIFAAADNSITVDINIDYFYPGMPLQITGSASNDITTEVVSIEGSTKIIVADALVNESATIYNVTFSDLSSTRHFFQNYIDALTFEEEIGSLLDPNTILVRLLSNMHELFYMASNWWVVRKSDKYKTTLNVGKYSEDGAFEDYEDMGFAKAFGFDETHFFADERTEIHTQRPQGLLEIKYSYSYPKETPCNVDFSRGGETQAPDLSAPSSQGRYTPECWTLHRYLGGSPTSTMYIQKNYEYGYEKSRYLTITPASASSETTWAESTPFPVKRGARGDVSVEFSAEENFGSGEGNVSYDIVFIWIVDKDGNYWYWNNLDIGGSPLDFYTWVGPFVAEQNRPVSMSWILDQIDETNPQTLSVNLEGMPVDGDLYFGLPQFNQTGSGFDDNVTIRYNLNFQYIPKINGSYQKYTGESHTITQPETGYNSSYKKQSYIGDANDPNILGALYYIVGSIYFLTSRWIESDGDAAIRKPFLWWCAFDIWNQYRPSPTVLEFVAAGVGSSWPHNVHHIRVTDEDSLTIGRLFEIITFEKDLQKCSLTGNMPEIYRDGYDYEDPYEFKYISS